MKLVRLVEPNGLLGLRMLCHRRSHLSEFHAAIGLPLHLATAGGRIFLDNSLVRRFKGILPRWTNTIATLKIAYVLHSLARELLHDVRVDRLQNHAAVGDRSLALLLRRDDATEEKTARPLV